MDDIHAHLYHHKWYPKKFQEAIAIDFLNRKNKVPTQELINKTVEQLNKTLTDEDGSKTIKILDYSDIKKRIILILDFGIELGEAELGIEQIHEEILGACSDNKNRLVGFAGLDPRRNNAAQIFLSAIKNLNAKGLKLHPTGGWSLLDQSTLKLVSIAADFGLPILSHIGKTVESLNDANAQPEPFIQLASRYPQTQFVAGHSGFTLWKEFIKKRSSIPENLFFDISGWQELMIGDGSNVQEDIRTLTSVFPNRICFGTDSPFYSYNLPFAEKKWIELVKNAVDPNYNWVTIEDLINKN